MVASLVKAGATATMLVTVCALLGVPSCSHSVCDCPNDPVGLVITTDAPVSAVTLSGPACTGGHFRCVPADFDDVIHAPCTEVQVEAIAEGLCVVDLVVGHFPLGIQRQMSRRPPGCCGGYIGDANHQGYITLTAGADAGVDGDAAADAHAD